jgi:F-type H+-transporting ATPase subunit delta
MREFKTNHRHFKGNKLSKNKGFSDTSANRYSLALYELAAESNLLSQVEENSTALLNLISNEKDFANLIKDPTISSDILINVINKISEGFNLENLFRNFLSFLITKRRFFYLEKILTNFSEICSKKRGEIKAEIKSAKELTQDEIRKITDELSSNFKSKIKLNYLHDQSLIGGLVVQVGSTMIDTSIKNKLQQIENTMIEA